MIMKDYRIHASKEIVAKFSMNHDVYGMKFKTTTQCVEWIISEHPELKDAPWDFSILGKDIVFLFYSLGNLVIEEVESC